MGDRGVGERPSGSFAVPAPRKGERPAVYADRIGEWYAASKSDRLNTLVVARRLQGAGMPPELAEVVVESLHTALVENVATKADIEAVRREMQGSERELSAEMEALPAKVEALKWYVAFQSVILLAVLGRVFEVI